MNALTFDQILRAAAELSPQERAALIERLQEQNRQPVVSVDDNLALLRAAQLHVQVNQEPSTRRVDWYDDGR